MKYLLTFLLTSQLQAATLVHWIRPASTGTESLEVKDEKGDVGLVKTSNWFQDGLELGEFAVPKTKETTPSLTKLQEIISRVQQAETKLKSVGTSYNSLNETSPHTPYFLIGETRIYEGTPQYKEIQVLVDELQKLPFKLKNGAALNRDHTKISHIAHGKVTKVKTYRKEFQCEKIGSPVRCLIPDWGVMYLPR